ncbi:hypothetical protein, partial [Yersinia ruckeri]|uniref:hypothetical protein n=1 Tax=Yersinia ruckeri TaxID=29486 RepID=UPI00223861E4
FSLAEDTDDLFVGKTLLHGHVLMWLMKTLLTSPCINQLGAGHHTTVLTLSLTSREPEAPLYYANHHAWLIKPTAD